MEFNGVSLMSSILDFAVWAKTGVDHACIVNVRTEAAVASYHDRVPYKVTDIATFLAGMRPFAGSDYRLALANGDAITPAEADQVATRLSQYIGSSPTCIKQANLSSEPSRLCKELMRGLRRRVAHLDGRFERIDADAAGGELPNSGAANDPATGAYLAAFNECAGSKLRYSGDRICLSNHGAVVDCSRDWKRDGERA